MRMRRTIGYCLNIGCTEYAKKLFRHSSGKTFQCNECFQSGQIRYEKGLAENTQPIFKEVRVAFNFSPSLDTYHDTAIVRDESLRGHHNVYHYSSPITQTEKRALQVAEQILATLNQMSELPVGANLPDFFESRLSWDTDLETFKKECSNWGESLRGTPLTRS